MAFGVGQQVVCVDASLPANPWHRAHALVLKKIYVVRTLEGPHYVDIDGSGRAWQNWRFRPLIEKKTETGMAILREILDRESIADRLPVHETR